MKKVWVFTSADEKCLCFCYTRPYIDRWGYAKSKDGLYSIYWPNQTYGCYPNGMFREFVQSLVGDEIPTWPYYLEVEL